MARYQDRKKAAAARMRYRPKPTPKKEIDILRCNMNLNQDIAAEKSVIESKSDAEEAKDIAAWMLKKAKSKGLTTADVKKREKAERLAQKQELAKEESKTTERSDNGKGTGKTDK
jgi:hypothetical protein